MSKHFYINETKEKAIINALLNEAFTPQREKVSLVRNFIDKNFIRSVSDDIDENGFPTKVKSVYLLSQDGTPIKPMSMKELLLYLDDRFQKMFKDNNDRREFLKQVIRDWFNKKISKEGVLSVNRIKTNENFKRHNVMLNESRAAQESVKAARVLFRDKNGGSEEDVKVFIETLKQKVGALRDNKAAKFTLGVANMYFDGELEDKDTNEKLSNTLMHITKNSSAFSSLDKNLNGLSAQEIISQFEQEISDLERSYMDKDANTEYTENTDYQIVPINTFEEAEQYGEYVVWCITQEESLFNHYTKNGASQAYFCLRNGFEDEPEEKGENHPLDSYGLSMISVIVDEDGKLKYSTSRWNNEGTILNPNEISELIGRSFYDTFKPNNKWASALNDVKQRLANGENPEDVFDEVGDFVGGFAPVKLKGKWNFINVKRQIINPNQWFDETDYFVRGTARVYVIEKGYNFLKTNGQLVSPNQWFDDVGFFDNGFVEVELKEKGYNFLKTNGQLVSPNQWFDSVGEFYRGFAPVELNGEWFHINTNGKRVD